MSLHHRLHHHRIAPATATLRAWVGWFAWAWALTLSLPLSLALSGEAEAASTTPWPELPALPQGRTEWVARDVWLNGIPSRIQRFESPLGVPEVLAHYRAHWARTQGADSAARENTWDGWAMLSTWHGPFHLVLQVKPGAGSGSQGLLSAVNVREIKRRSLPADWPTWPPTTGLSVRQVMESVDGPRRSFHVLAVSHSAKLGQVRDQLKRLWQERGWRVRHEHATPHGYLATCERGDQTLEMTVASAAAASSTSEADLAAPPAMAAPRTPSMASPVAPDSEAAAAPASQRPAAVTVLLHLVQPVALEGATP